MECLWQFNKEGYGKFSRRLSRRGTPRPHNYSVNRHFVATAISIWVSLSSAACSAHAARMPKPDPLGVRPKRA